jgi:hypothetical protein
MTTKMRPRYGFADDGGQLDDGILRSLHLAALQERLKHRFSVEWRQQRPACRRPHGTNSTLIS